MNLPHHRRYRPVVSRAWEVMTFALLKNPTEQIWKDWFLFGILRRYRLLQGTRHCPVKRALIALAPLAALLVALLYLYEWHVTREDALAEAQTDMVRAMIERDEVVALTTLGSPREEIVIKEDW